MSQNNYPTYISNTPEGKDSLKGESHSKIADEITNIVIHQSKNIQRQVIGLEGNWGTGKSNIIKILEDKLNHDNYLHFIFDTWGHQEDLNRRAILEELIDFLSMKDSSFKDSEWEKKENQLKGKTIDSKKTIFPEVKLCWIFFITAIALYHFLKEYLVYDILPLNQFNIKYSLMIWGPFILFGIGFYQLYNEWKKQNNENKKRDKKLTKTQLIGRLFYLINGEEIESTTTDFVIENEPSNKNFRQFLDFINNRLETKGKTLVLTIDNIDRLTKDKIKSLWSTVNIFFADKNDNKYYNNIWLIIPYDETKILNAFSENDKDDEIGLGLIEKTFSVKFRVTPPIPSNWEMLFEDKLKMAFGTEIIPIDEIDYIKRIFDGYSKEIITPRQIINFINDLVTIYSINKEVKFRYLSLFISAKNEIIHEPITSILGNTYLKETVKIIFAEDVELQKNISAITFGVPLDMAEEIVYSREIKNILQNGSEKELEKFKNNPIAFKNHFFKEFNSLDLNNLSLNGLEKLPLLLHEIKKMSLIDDFQLNETYWKNLKRKIININNSHPHNLRLNNFHKEIYLYNHVLGKEVIEKCIESMYYQMRDNQTEEEFIGNLKEIDIFLIENIDIKVSDLYFNPERKRKINPDNYIYLISEFPEDYNKFNLNCNENELTNYYLKDDKTIELDTLYNDINEIVIIKENESYKFKNVIEQLKNEIKDINSTNIIDIHKYTTCFIKISNDKPIDDISIPVNIINQNINNYTNDDRDIQTILICFSFYHINTINNYPYIRNIFNDPNSYNVDIEKLASKIEYFREYDGMLKMINNDGHNFQLILELVKELTKKSYGISRLNIKWVLENYGSILLTVFNNDKNHSNSFYKRLDGWSSFAKDHLNKSPMEICKIDLSILDFAMIIDNDLSKILISKSNEFLNSLTTVEINDIIENKNTFNNNLFKKLNSKNKIEQLFLTEKLETQIFDYLNKFNKGDINIIFSDSLALRQLFNKVDPNKRNRFIVNSIKTLNNNSKLNSNHISMYINLIIEQNLLSKINSNVFKQFILNHNFKSYFPDSRYNKKIIDHIFNLKNQELKILIWDIIKRKHSGNEIKEYAIKKGFKLK